MTASDMVDVIEAALLAHPVTRTGHCECGARVHWATPENVATHQAAAVLAAISEAGTVEWGVRDRDGDVDEWRHKENAENALRSMEFACDDPSDSCGCSIGPRPELVSRRVFTHTGPWTAVEG